MSAAKHTPVQFGQTIGADFEASTMTVEMEPGYVVAVAPVAVLPRGTYCELLKAAKAVAFSNGFDAGLPDKMEALRAAIAKAEGSAAA